MIGSKQMILAASGAAMLLAMGGSALAQSAGGPTLEDREAIEATMFRYSRGLDRGDPDLYTSAWTEDGEFIVNGQVAYSGHDELAGVVEGVAASHEATAAEGAMRQLFHMDANASVEFIDADTAIHHAYFLTLARTGEGLGSEIAVIAVGSTEDTLEKIDGEWLIVKREVFNGP